MDPVAIFRFSPTEGPGRLAEWLDGHGVAWRLVALDEGATVPADARAFSGLALMGGPMSANDDLPWNAPLLGLLRGAVAADVPVLGHCLGGQLLAKALGAEVMRTQRPEIGWGEVNVTEAAEAQAWFGNRGSFTTFQWHYEVFGLPHGATRVLTNDGNPEQAYAKGKHIGFQSHVEMTRAMVETWCRTGAAELPARTVGAMQSRSDILADVDARLAELARVAEDVYAHWAKGLVRHESRS
jgi:GMP synthase-like glutamine amidotransferase